MEIEEAVADILEEIDDVNQAYASIIRKKIYEAIFFLRQGPFLGHQGFEYIFSTRVGKSPYLYKDINCPADAFCLSEAELYEGDKVFPLTSKVLAGFPLEQRGRPECFEIFRARFSDEKPHLRLGILLWPRPDKVYNIRLRVGFDRSVSLEFYHMLPWFFEGYSLLKARVLYDFHRTITQDPVATAFALEKYREESDCLERAVKNGFCAGKIIATEF